MRYLRFIHYLFLLILCIIDNYLGVFYHQFPWFIHASSLLSLLGILILSKTETFREVLFKTLFISLIMDVTHYQSFPIFLISNLLAVVFLDSWNRHIGTSSLELAVQAIVIIMIREMVIWILLPYTKGVSYPLFTYLAQFVVWTVILNLIMLPLVIRMNKQIHHYVLQRNQNLYIK